MADRSTDPTFTGSPYDTPVSSGLRFLMELIAWTAGPWAVADLAGSWWAAVPAAAVLVAVPAMFSTRGDKRQAIVAVPGIVRLLIEIDLMTVAVVGAVIAWPIEAAVGAIIIVAAAALTGIRRARWLAAGAPQVAG